MANLARAKKIKAPQVKSNPTVSKDYLRGVMVLIKTMRDDLNGKVVAWYKRHMTDVVQDAVDSIDELIEELEAHWEEIFNKASRKLSQNFAMTAGVTSQKTLKRMFKQMGLTISMDLSPRMQAVLMEIASWSTSLISRIPKDYLGGVKKLLMESVEKGRDIRALEDGLYERYEITHKHARMLANDQTNKAMQGLARAKMQDAGIKRGYWQHNAASKKWRPEHVEMDGQEFDLEVGLFDPVQGREVKPGELPNCNCSFRPKIEVVIDE